MVRSYYTPKIVKKKVISELGKIVDDILETDSSVSYVAALILEEAVTNVTKYAYPRKKGSLYYSILINGDDVDIVIEDKGIPYNPTDSKIPKVNGNRIGGNGIRIIRNLSNIKYVRDGNTNKLYIKALQKG